MNSIKLQNRAKSTPHHPSSPKQKNNMSSPSPSPSNKRTYETCADIEKDIKSDFVQMCSALEKRVKTTPDDDEWAELVESSSNIDDDSSEDDENDDVDENIDAEIQDATARLRDRAKQLPTTRYDEDDDGNILPKHKLHTWPEQFFYAQWECINADLDERNYDKREWLDATIQLLAATNNAQRCAALVALKEVQHYAD